MVEVTLQKKIIQVHTLYSSMYFVDLHIWIHEEHVLGKTVSRYRYAVSAHFLKPKKYTFWKPNFKFLADNEILIQSNLFVTDTKGTGIRPVSVL